MCSTLDPPSYSSWRVWSLLSSSYQSSLNHCDYLSVHTITPFHSLSIHGSNPSYTHACSHFKCSLTWSIPTEDESSLLQNFFLVSGTRDSWKVNLIIRPSRRGTEYLQPFQGLLSPERLPHSRASLCFPLASFCFWCAGAGPLYHLPHPLPDSTLDGLWLS